MTAVPVATSASTPTTPSMVFSMCATPLLGDESFPGKYGHPLETVCEPPPDGPCAGATLAALPS